MDRSARVEPDGPAPCDWAVVGEAPAEEEFKQGRAFVGPSGRLLWPLIRRYGGGLDRSQVYVTNLCKYRLDDSLDGDEKLTPEEFAECRDELLAELGFGPQPKRILAVGTLAARALMGDAFDTMEHCSGMCWWVDASGATVVPAFHPAAALRPGGERSLAFLADAISAWRFGRVLTPRPDPRLLAIDTEGWPDDPIMLTWARRDDDGQLRSDVVYPADVPLFWESAARDSTIVWHNALWDWRVVEAMGVPAPWRVPYIDTMERAYLRQVEPQGLKELAWKHLGVRMRHYEDVVGPWWEGDVRAAAAGYIEAGTTFDTHTAKGRLRKRPIPRYDERAKALRRASKAETLAERMGYPGPSLRYVPKEEAEKYAVEDAIQTLALAEIL